MPLSYKQQQAQLLVAAALCSLLHNNPISMLVLEGKGSKANLTKMSKRLPQQLRDGDNKAEMTKHREALQRGAIDAVGQMDLSDTDRTKVCPGGQPSANKTKKLYEVMTSIKNLSQAWGEQSQAKAGQIDVLDPHNTEILKPLYDLHTPNGFDGKVLHAMYERSQTDQSFATQLDELFPISGGATMSRYALAILKMQTRSIHQGQLQ